MKHGSLRFRLTLAAAALIFLALVVGGFGLFWIFDEALDRRTADELNYTAKLLAGGVGFDASGMITVDQTPADPRFATPYGGLYWQIESAGVPPLRSRSLWDKRIVLPSLPRSDMPHHATTDLPGVHGGSLIAVFRTVRLRSGTVERLVVIVVAMDRTQLAASREMVVRLLPSSIVALALALACAMALFVGRALRPLQVLRTDLQKVQIGAESRLRGAYPLEVQPLVDGLNRLVAQQEAALSKAQTEAADMAHGLKTPLAVIDALARRVEDSDPGLAEEIGSQSRAMSEQVSRTLARARATASPGLQQARTPVAPVIERLVSAMRRLPGSDRLSWRVAADADVCCPFAEGDLLEMLGNLIDNARKWAETEVVVTTSATRLGKSVCVSDDGPGLDIDKLAIIGRGQRWDNTVAGSGFGLAITRDLAEATGAQLDLAARPGGGLSATIRWSSTS